VEDHRQELQARGAMSAQPEPKISAATH